MLCEIVTYYELMSIKLNVIILSYPGSFMILQLNGIRLFNQENLHIFKPFPKPVRTSLSKNAVGEKEKLLAIIVFYPFIELSSIFTKFKNVICKLIEFRRV